MKPETKFKTDIVKAIRAQAGYARRLEDQFAVGLPDLILIPDGGPTFLVEAKIIRGTWGPTPRQQEELNKIHAAGGHAAVIGLPIEGGFVLRNWDGGLERSYPNLTLLPTALRRLARA